jgi:DNA-directed RNA polymerase subunit RPC12/RpoP
LETALSFDEDRWQADTGHLFVAPRRAEGLEQVLFHCYDCGAWDQLVATGDCIACRGCGSRWWYGPSGTLYPQQVPASGSRSPITVAGWQGRQLPALAAALQLPASAAASQAGPLPYRCSEVQLFTGYRTRPLTPQGVVECRLTRRELVVGPRPAITVPLAEVQGLNVQYAAQLEFYWRRRLYVLRFHGSTASAYRVEQTIKRLQEISLQDH